MIEFVEAVVQVAKKVQDWAQFRNERSDRRFNQLAEPTFAAMKVVHADYLVFLESCLQDINTGKKISDVRDKLEQLRLAEEAQRTAIRAATYEICNEATLSDFHALFQEIQYYFGATPWTMNNSPSSILKHALRKAASEEALLTDSTHPEARSELASAFESTIDILREQWEQVSREFAKCQVRSVMK